MKSFIIKAPLKPTFILFDKNNKFIVKHWYADAGYAKELAVSDIDNIVAGKVAPQHFTIDKAIEIIKILTTTEPIDIRITCDTCDIQDDIGKIDIINSLCIAKYEIATTKTIIPMSKQSVIFACKKQQESKQISDFINSALTNSNSKKYKSIKTFIQKLNK